MVEENMSREWIENNAWLIFKADFYPIYTQRIGKGLSSEELIILSFIYYWTKNWNSIYATNEDLCKLIWAWEWTVRNSLKRLVDDKLIEIESKPAVWIWTDRKIKFIGGLENTPPAEPWKPHLRGEKNTPPCEQNKFVGDTLDYSEKSQKNSNPSEPWKTHPYNNNIIEYNNNIQCDVVSQSNDCSQIRGDIGQTRKTNVEFDVDTCDVKVWSKKSKQEIKKEKLDLLSCRMKEEWFREDVIEKLMEFNEVKKWKKFQDYQEPSIKSMLSILKSYPSFNSMIDMLDNCIAKVYQGPYKYSGKQSPIDLSKEKNNNVEKKHSWVTVVDWVYIY